MISGLSLVLNYLWVFILISVGLWRQVSWPFTAPLWLLILNMVIYVPLSIWMILDKRRDLVLFATLWAITSFVFNLVSPSDVSPAFVFLSFLIVFSSTNYHVTMMKPTTPSYVTSLAGVLALIQAAYLALAFFFVSLLALSQARNPLAGAGIANPLGISLAVGMVVYVMLGAGMMKGKRDFLFCAVLAAILESALAALTIFFTRGGFYNLLSMPTLFLSTYCYWAKT